MEEGISKRERGGAVPGKVSSRDVSGKCGRSTVCGQGRREALGDPCATQGPGSALLNWDKSDGSEPNEQNETGREMLDNRLQSTCLRRYSEINIACYLPM